LDRIDHDLHMNKNITFYQQRNLDEKNLQNLHLREECYRETCYRHYKLYIKINIYIKHFQQKGFHQESLVVEEMEETTIKLEKVNKTFFVSL
jgi:hypothetical protein